MNAHVRMNDEFADAPTGGMAYVTDMLGTAFRDKMIATMGGTTIKVPSKSTTLTADYILVKCLGEVDAAELVEIMPGEAIYIPTGNNRADAVAALVMDGKNNNEISRVLGVSDRQVRRLRARAGLGGSILSKRLSVCPNHLSRTLRETGASALIAAE